MRFGMMVKQRREQAGLSLRALAEQIGFDYTYLSLIENGHRYPGGRYVYSLASFLGVPVKTMLTMVADEKAEARLSKGELQPVPLNRDT